jgi:hypothetical protein
MTYNYNFYNRITYLFSPLHYWEGIFRLILYLALEEKSY